MFMKKSIDGAIPVMTGKQPPMITESPPIQKTEDKVVETPKKKKGKTYQIKKLYFDKTSGLVYGLGVSLIHLAMFLAMFAVKWPDTEKAAAYDKEYEVKMKADGITKDMEIYDDRTCGGFSGQLYYLMWALFVTHAGCFLVNIFREIYETMVNDWGKLMRVFEVLCMIAYFGCVILGMDAEAKLDEIKHLSYHVHDKKKGWLMTLTKVEKRDCFTEK